jgi:hypothetical protein
MPGPSSFALPEQQIGAVAYLYGITNDGTQITFAGLDSFEFDSDELTLTWDEKANKDTTGNIQNFTQTNFRYERSLKIYPSGATRAKSIDDVAVCESRSRSPEVSASPVVATRAWTSPRPSSTTVRT